MQQIADWLKTLGLAQYAQCFAENDINFAILSDLSDQDLKELGVSSLGHRRQLLGAITLSALLVVTFRPEFNPPWVGQSGVTSVTLNRLGEREAEAIIARLGRSRSAY
jgi:hypothetical protein